MEDVVEDVRMLIILVQVVGQAHQVKVIVVEITVVLLYKLLVVAVVLVVLVEMHNNKLVQEEMVFHLISQEVQ
jgi:hypothetical protein